MSFKQVFKADSQMIFTLLTNMLLMSFRAAKGKQMDFNVGYSYEQQVIMAEAFIHWQRLINEESRNISNDTTATRLRKAQSLL